METLFIALLKTNVLIAIFFIAYYCLLRKDTFFHQNRFYLLIGLATALVLPFIYLTKTIWITKVASNTNFTYDAAQSSTIQEIVTPFDWYSIVFWIYVAGACLLFFKLLVDCYSLNRILSNQKPTKAENFTLINVNEKIAPFSFFNRIVFNSSLYSKEELDQILEHEKVHSEQYHSIDVLVMRVFCLIFWFNPFIWFYQKAMLQNLEFIADNEASNRLSDKKQYQLALLKCTTNTNCVALANHFHQSLIKKRIVMLNKKQSPKRNLFKYALIIPALVAFVMLFQIKVIAQEKTFETTISTSDKDVVLVIDKNTTDFKLKQEIQKLKENHGITLKVSKVKRNTNFEITAIKIQYEDANGNKGSSQVASGEPIAPISIIKKTDLNGKSSISLLSGKPVLNPNKKKIAIVSKEKDSDSFSFSFSDDEDDSSSYSSSDKTDTPTPPNTASTPEPKAPIAPIPPKVKVEKKIKVITEKNGDTPTVYINGEKIDFNLDDLDLSFDPSNFFNFDGLNEDITIQGNPKKGTIIITSKDGKTEINMGKEMERFKEEMQKAKSEMMKAFREREKVTPEIEKAKKEMEKAKAAMEKARIELEKARAEALKQQKV